MPAKLKHQSRSVEQHLAVPRSEVWPAVEALVDELGPAARLSVEPPWRLAFEMDTSASALDFWQGTFLIRDDGAECHVAFGLVFDPVPSEAVLAEVEVILADIARRLAALPGNPARSGVETP